jgi:hypothetical protein
MFPAISFKFLKSLLKSFNLIAHSAAAELCLSVEHKKILNSIFDIENFYCHRKILILRVS